VLLKYKEKQKEKNKYIIPAAHGIKFKDELIMLTPRKGKA
jgi:hypothetical protein